MLATFIYPTCMKVLGLIRIVLVPKCLTNVDYLTDSKGSAAIYSCCSVCINSICQFRRATTVGCDSSSIFKPQSLLG